MSAQSDYHHQLAQERDARDYCAKRGEYSKIGIAEECLAVTQDEKDDFIRGRVSFYLSLGESWDVISAKSQAMEDWLNGLRD